MKRTYDPSKDKVARCGCSISMSGRVTKACGMHAGDDTPEATLHWEFMLLLGVILWVVVALYLWNR